MCRQARNPTPEPPPPARGRHSCEGQRTHSLIAPGVGCTDVVQPASDALAEWIGGAAEGADAQADAGANLDRNGEQRLQATVARFISGEIRTPPAAPSCLSPVPRPNTPLKGSDAWRRPWLSRRSACAVDTDHTLKPHHPSEKHYKAQVLKSNECKYRHTRTLL